MTEVRVGVILLQRWPVVTNSSFCRHNVPVVGLVKPTKVPQTLHAGSDVPCCILHPVPERSHSPISCHERAQKRKRVRTAVSYCIVLLCSAYYCRIKFKKTTAETHANGNAKFPYKVRIPKIPARVFQVQLAMSIILQTETSKLLENPEIFFYDICQWKRKVSI